jgi:hypothetical protein
LRQWKNVNEPAHYYIHNSKSNGPVGFDESVTFIQIVNTSKLVKDRTSKFKQWKTLEKSINRIIPMKNSKIARYRLFSTDELDRLTSFIKEKT